MRTLVREWQRPLEEALEEMLLQPELSQDDLRDVHQAVSMLDLSEQGAVAISERLQRRFLQQEERYQQGVARIEKKLDPADVDEGIRLLKRMPDYKDASEKIRQGETWIAEYYEAKKREEEDKRKKERQKIWRRRFIKLGAVAACAGILIAVLLIQNHHEQQLVQNYSEELQTLIDNGQEREMISTLRELLAYGIQPDGLYSYSEAALEQMAGREGFKAAFQLRDDMISKAGNAIKVDQFNAWADGQLANGELDTEEKWAILQDALADGRRDPVDNVVQKTYENRVAAFLSDLDSMAPQDMETWIAGEKSYLSEIAIEPDIALELCQRLRRAGFELTPLFPDGIAVALPVVPYINATRTIPENAPPDPDESMPLSVYIQERTTNELRQGEAIYWTVYHSRSSLKNGVNDLQLKYDSHYFVRILPNYLEQIPLELMPIRLQDYTCLIAMQQEYRLRGWIVTTPDSSSMRNNVTAGSGSISYYRGYFSTTNSVIIYDTNDTTAYRAVYSAAREPIVAEKGWLDRHTREKNTELFTAENMLGAHDDAALKDAYDRYMDEIGMKPEQKMDADETINSTTQQQGEVSGDEVK